MLIDKIKESEYKDKMRQRKKFVASDDLKILKVEVISECEGSCLTILCL